MSFDSLGLCAELLKVVTEQGYLAPTSIQYKAIPAVLNGRDVVAIAQTGSGKTACFTLPMLQLLATGRNLQPKNVRALVITPTRELAAQVAKNVETYSQYLNLCSAAVFGGVRIEPQIAQIQAGVDVLVATPGRLKDLYQQQAIEFKQLEILILDEADRMLDLGFVEDIREIQKMLPENCQTLMFSATFSSEIKSLVTDMVKDPLFIEVAQANRPVDSVKQKVYPVDKIHKSELLIHLIKKHQWRQVLVFCRTKQGADRLVIQLKEIGIQAASIHANRTQHARTQALDGFRNASLRLLVATDIATRGIDVDNLPCVVNFDLPYMPEDYVHRIGRTGRSGASGLAISFYSEDESKQLKAIEAVIGRKLPQETIQGFAPTKKSVAQPTNDDEYGNFEPDPNLSGRRKTKGRASRDGQSSKAKRRKF